MHKTIESLTETNAENTSFICPICLDNTTKTWILFNCTHQFCCDCLRTYFKGLTDTKSFPIRCPNDQCKQDIDLNDIEGVLDKSDVEKVDLFSLTWN